MNRHLLFAAMVSLLLSVSVPATLAQETVPKDDLDESMLVIEGNVAKLRLLEAQIQEASSGDREKISIPFPQRDVHVHQDA